MKVIAITHPQTYGWRVLVELNNAEIQTLSGETRTLGEPPKVGTEFDLKPIMERLKGIENRENEMRCLMGLLAKFAQTPAAAGDPKTPPF